MQSLNAQYGIAVGCKITAGRHLSTVFQKIPCSDEGYIQCMVSERVGIVHDIVKYVTERFPPVDTSICIGQKALDGCRYVTVRRLALLHIKIGSRSCRERVCQSV